MDHKAFHASVIEELRQFDRALPEWIASGPYADPQEPLDELDRREWERLERLERQARSAQGERTRERAAREHARPWDEHNPWGLRKRVWKERRDAERVLLDRRDERIWEQQQQLEQQHERWLADVLALAPYSYDWCVEQTQRREHGSLALADMEHLWQQRHSAATQRAHKLLTQADTRACIDRAMPASLSDPAAIAAALTHALLSQAHADHSLFPPRPVLFAALARLYAAQGER